MAGHPNIDYVAAALRHGLVFDQSDRHNRSPPQRPLEGDEDYENE
jgi:hypothetical protein